jgi:hypothetical protein
MPSRPWVVLFSIERNWRPGDTFLQEEYAWEKRRVWKIVTEGEIAARD